MLRYYPQPSPRITFDDVVAAIDEADKHTKRQPALVLLHKDQRVDWSSFPSGVPADMTLKNDQDRDLRWPLHGGGALHAHCHDRKGFLRLHIDRTCPVREQTGHLLSDTWVVHGAAGGLGLGLLLGVTGWPLLAIAGVGGLAGGAATLDNLEDWVISGWSRQGHWMIEPKAEYIARRRARALRHHRPSWGY